MPFATSSFLFLVVRPGALVASLLLVAMLFATSSFLFLVVWPGAPSSFLLLVAMPFATILFLVVRPEEPLVASLLLVAMPFATSSFLFLVVWPGAPSSFLLLVAMPFATILFLVVRPEEPLVASLLLVAMPGAPRVNPWRYHVLHMCRAEEGCLCVQGGVLGPLNMRLSLLNILGFGSCQFEVALLVPLPVSFFWKNLRIKLS